MDLMFSQFQPNKGSKKAKKSGSNIFSLFSQKQIQEFKEAFGIIDNDKDGIITAPDLKKAFEVKLWIFQVCQSIHADWQMTICAKFNIDNESRLPNLMHNHRPGFTRSHGSHGLLVVREKESFSWTPSSTVAGSKALKVMGHFYNGLLPHLSSILSPQPTGGWAASNSIKNPSTTGMWRSKEADSTSHWKLNQLLNATLCWLHSSSNLPSNFP